jgi:hypothetical protein
LLPDERLLLGATDCERGVDDCELDPGLTRVRPLLTVELPEPRLLLLGVAELRPTLEPDDDCPRFTPELLLRPLAGVLLLLSFRSDDERPLLGDPLVRPPPE